MRFYHQGGGWRTCDPIRTLGRQVESVWPRKHPTDGTRAGSNHVGWPVSDHGPDPNGIVRAIDVGVYGLAQGNILAEALRASRDRRLAYVIFNGRIFSSTNTPWTWREYRGSNPHRTHVHVSMMRAGWADTDPALFDINLGGRMITVSDWQEMLNEAGADPPLAVDGDFGPKTRAAMIEALEASALTPTWVNQRIRQETRGMLTKGSIVKLKGVMAPDDA